MRGFIKHTMDIVAMFIEVDWIKTIRLNFHCLPFDYAIKLPILLYHSKIDHLTGSIRIESDIIKFGMIKLGIKHEVICTSNLGVVIDNRGVIVFRGAGVLGNGSVISISENGLLDMGENFGITGNFTLHCHDRIIIGRDFSCSWNVSLCDTDFHYLEDPRTGIIRPITAPIQIGTSCWICQHSLILKGTVFPDDIILGANSLANKSYSEALKYSLIAGNPAKILPHKIRRKDLHHIKQLQGWLITAGLSTFNSIE